MATFCVWYYSNNNKQQLTHSSYNMTSYDKIQHDPSTKCDLYLFLILLAIIKFTDSLVIFDVLDIKLLLSLDVLSRMAAYMAVCHTISVRKIAKLWSNEGTRPPTHFVLFKNGKKDLVRLSPSCSNHLTPPPLVPLWPLEVQLKQQKCINLEESHQYIDNNKFNSRIT